MTLLDILSSDSTIVDLKGETKEDIIAELVNSLAIDNAITDREKVLQAVLEREKIMSTGIGDGIAATKKFPSDGEDLGDFTPKRFF